MRTSGPPGGGQKDRQPCGEAEGSVVPGGLGTTSSPAQGLMTQALKRLAEKGFAARREARHQAVTVSPPEFNFLIGNSGDVKRIELHQSHEVLSGVWLIRRAQ